MKAGHGPWEARTWIETSVLSSEPPHHPGPVLCLCFVIPLSEKEGRDEIWVQISAMSDI